MRHRYVDLHIHTSFSDGSLNPREIVEEAKKNKIAAVGITDHDTMEGVIFTKNIEPCGVEIVPGIELGTDYEGKEIHLLGYYCDPENPALEKTCEIIKESRYDRIKKMILKLQKMGVDIKFDDVLKQAGGDMLGRPHLALAVCQKGYCKTPAEVFAKYIGNNCQAYVERYRLKLKEAIDIICEAGGIPVLAHPGLYKADKFLPSMIGLGIRGIEVFHPEHSFLDVRRYIKIADKYKLLITGGSDFHGKAVGSSDSIGAVKIDYRYLHKLKMAKRVEKMI